jgi:hypothetical protein
VSWSASWRHLHVRWHTNNAVGYALAIDAQTHDGPGQASHFDLFTGCQKLATDVVATEGITTVAAVLIVKHEPQPFEEPLIMPYTIASLGRLWEFEQTIDDIR